MALRDLYAAVWDRGGGPAWQARHRMTAERYQAVFDDLTGRGYRLRCVCGYEGDGQDLYAALFDQAGGPAWQAHHRMTAGDYQATFDQLAHQGYRLRNVSGYAVNGQELYAAIWEQTGGPAWQARHRMTSDQYQATFDQLVPQGYRLTCVSAYAVNGQDLYAAIWKQTGGPAWQARHRLDAAAFETVSDTLARQGYHPVLVSACSVNGRDLYAGLWQQGAAPETVAHHGMPSAGYQAIFDQLKAQGYRPRAVAGYAGAQPCEAAVAFTMQPQQQTEWCWAATAVSVDHYYNPASTWTQCALASAQLGRSDCCGTGASGPCNVPNYLDQVLSRVGRLDHMDGNPVDYGTLLGELVERRPVGIRVGWQGGGGHFFVAAGCEGGDMVLLEDPIYGESLVTYDTLKTAYQGTGTWTHSYFTKA